MNIHELVNNAETNEFINALNIEKHLCPIDSKAYKLIYESLKYKNSCQVADDNGNINFFIKIGSLGAIEKIINSNENITIKRSDSGFYMEYEIKGTGIKEIFNFSVYNNRNLYEIKCLLKTRKIIMHFVIYEKLVIVKGLSVQIEIDDSFINSLKYFLELSYTGKFPRLNKSEAHAGSGSYFKVESDGTILYDILSITENLQKWGSSDSFTLSLKLEDCYKLIFIGTVSNLPYIKKELQKKYKIINEGETLIEGIPFLKFDSNLVYFFETNLEEQE